MAARPGLGTMVGRAMLLRCPLCGGRGVFRSWFAMRERCPRCGLKFGQREGAFLGSMSLNYGVAGIAFFVYLGLVLAFTLPDPPVVLLTAGSVAIVLVTILLFFPWSKTLWAAIEVMLLDPSDIDAAPQHERLY